MCPTLGYSRSGIIIGGKDSRTTHTVRNPIPDVSELESTRSIISINILIILSVFIIIRVKWCLPCLPTTLIYCERVKVLSLDRDAYFVTVKVKQSSPDADGVP